MVFPTEPVTLKLEDVKALNERLALMRHDINNHVTLIIAAVELMRVKPQTTERWMGTLAEQPAKIVESVRKFSSEFEQAMGIKKS
jgi:hypothetical protein